MVGQTFLEGQTTLLSDIPQGYTSITSGLGDATPAYLIIVPLKQNDQVEGILELASFKRFEDYEINFLERCSESIASALISAKTTEKMSLLITELQQRSEQMRAQEEEMRQNMEELVATQEHQNRLQQELQGEYTAKPQP